MSGAADMKGGIHRGDRPRLTQCDFAWQGRERIGEFASLPRQSCEIAGAAVDRAPAFGLGEHRCLVDAICQRAFLGRKLFHLQPGLAMTLPLSNPIGPFVTTNGQRKC